MSLDDTLNRADEAREECECSEVPALRAEVATQRARADRAANFILSLSLSDAGTVRRALQGVREAVVRDWDVRDGSLEGSGDSGPESNVSVEGVSG